MKGLAILSVLLVFGNKITSTRALAVGDKCTNNGAVATYPFRNTQFYYCSGGFVYLGTCMDGRIFDQTTATCNYPGGTGTNPGTRTINCLGNNYATYPYPGNKNLYYMCLNNRALVVQCPIGYYYSLTMKSCTNGSGNVCPSNTVTALADPSGNCSNFILCVNGVANLQSCPSGYYFQPSTLNCGTAVPSNCNSTPGTTSCSQNGQMQAVARNCQVFNYCLNGAWTTISCPPNYYFSPTTLTCGPTRPSTCTASTGSGSYGSFPFNTESRSDSGSAIGIVNCSSTPDGQFADSTNCQNYILCINGAKISMSCPVGNYYNPVTFACGTTVPSTCP